MCLIGICTLLSTDCESRKLKLCFHKDMQSLCSTETLNKAYKLAFDQYHHIRAELDLLKEGEFNLYSSLGHYMFEKLEKKLQKYSQDIIFQNALKCALISPLNQENSYHGSPSIFDVDLKGFLSYVELEGNLRYSFKNSVKYSDIAQSIFNEIEKGGRQDFIRFNHAVDEIEHSEEKSQIKVSCENEEIFYSDMVILTMPIEIVKSFVLNGKIKPKLAKEKIESIRKFRLGQITKLFVKFKNPVDPEIDCIRFYPSSKFYDMMRQISKVPLSEAYTTLYGMSRVNKSEWWLLWLSTELTIKLKESNCEKFIENLFDTLNVNYGLDLKVDFSEFYISDWTSNKFFRGTYSYLPVGATESDIENLLEPVFYDDGTALLFSGEMSQPKFYSTTHGAYSSGIREAERVIKLLNF